MTVEDLRQNAAAFPANPTAHCELGQALLERRETDAALESFSRAVALAPTVKHYCAVGETLSLLGRFPEAQQTFERAVSLAPDDLHAARHLAWVCLIQRRTLLKARELLGAAIVRGPDRLDDYVGFCLAWLLAEQPERPEVTKVMALLAARRDLSTSMAAGLAKALMNLGRYADARRVLSSGPDGPDRRIDMARADLALGGLGAARITYARALREYPEHGGLLAHYLMFLVRADDVPRARALCGSERGQRLLGSRARAIYTMDGSLAGKTLLLRAVGGYGDNIQWVRFVPQLAGLGCRVIVECPPALVALFKDVPGAAGLVAPYDPLPPLDLEIRADLAALSLKWNWADMRSPYLHATARARPWFKGVDAPGLRVGLCWDSGYNSEFHFDPSARRSVPASLLEPLLAVQGTTFYSIGRTDCARPDAVVPTSDAFVDFADAAAAIEAMDLVVTVDTSLAHLAGALGRPTLLMLPLLPCWRWQHCRTDSPWYPTIRLLRQRTAGDWRPVVAGVVQEVAALARQRTDVRPGRRTDDRGPHTRSRVAHSHSS